MSDAGLFMHQEDGADWLADRATAYLGDRPGLGKTRTLLTAVNRAQGVQEPYGMIVCPAIVRSHWKREHAVINGTDGPFTDRLDRSRIHVYSPEELVNGSYGLMAALLRDGINTIIVDEAHYYKNAESLRTKYVLGKDGYARRMKRRYLASGTPVPREPGEFWTVVGSMFPEVALKYGIRKGWEWRDRFVKYRQVNYKKRAGGTLEMVTRQKASGLKNEEQFREFLAEFMLRRTPNDVGLDVPRLFWQLMPLSAQEAIDDRFPGMEGLRERLDAGESISELLNDPHVARYRRHVGEAKVPLVCEVVANELLCSEEKIVIFAYHKTVLKDIAKRLRSFGVCYIDGDVPQKKRDEQMECFMTDPKFQVFVGQNGACQTGVDLYAAQRAIFVEPEWTGYANDQLGHRIARIGSDAERCIAQMVCLEGTLDEWIVRQNHTETVMYGQMFAA